MSKYYVDDSTVIEFYGKIYTVKDFAREYSKDDLELAKGAIRVLLNKGSAKLHKSANKKEKFNSQETPYKKSEEIYTKILSSEGESGASRLDNKGTSSNTDNTQLNNSVYVDIELSSNYKNFIKVGDPLELKYSTYSDMIEISYAQSEYSRYVIGKFYQNKLNALIPFVVSKLKCNVHSINGNTYRIKIEKVVDQKVINKYSKMKKLTTFEVVPKLCPEIGTQLTIEKSKRGYLLKGDTNSFDSRTLSKSIEEKLKPYPFENIIAYVHDHIKVNDYIKILIQLAVVYPEYNLDGTELTRDQLISFFKLNGKSDDFINFTIENMINKGIIKLIPLYTDDGVIYAKDELVDKYNLRGQTEAMIETFLKGFDCSNKPPKQDESSQSAYAKPYKDNEVDASAKKAKNNFSNTSFPSVLHSELVENLMSFTTKIYGVTIDNRQTYISRLTKGKQLRLSREPNNPYDSNAVAIYDGSNQLGYLPRAIASFISTALDKGINYRCEVDNIVGGGSKNYGARIVVSRLYGDEPIKAHKYEVYEDDDYQPEDFFAGMDEDERQGWDDWSEYVNDH